MSVPPKNDAERILALEAKCQLLSACLTKADAKQAVLVEALAKLVRQVDRHAASVFGRAWMPDHACRECVPRGEIVVEGFRCGLHLARAALKEAGSP